MNVRDSERVFGPTQVERVRRRRYRLRESAVEVFLRRGKRRSLFLDFGSEPRDHARRNDFVRALELRVRVLGRLRGNLRVPMSISRRILIRHR